MSVTRRLYCRALGALAATAALWTTPPAFGADETMPWATYATPHLVRLPDGRRMNLTCMGEGSPVVLLEAGLGPSRWGFVQPKMARITRSCSYDRAGMGFSDVGPRPRDAVAVAADLHALLTAAGLKGPYVLVGHSLGGFFVRLFADLYPEQVAGMVLIDPSAEDSKARTIALVPAMAKDEGPSQTDMMKRCAIAAGAGEMKLGTGVYQDCVPDLPKDVPPSLASALLDPYRRPAMYSTEISELENLDRDGAEVVAHQRSYGDMPLIVLSGVEKPKIPSLSDSENQALVNLQKQLHDEQAALSSGGQSRAIKSGHYIQVEQPQAVVDAVDEVVTAVRQRRASAGS